MSVDEMAGRLGLSVAEFSRYSGLGIIKIKVTEATGDNGVSEVVVQLGNKVMIAVCPPDPAPVEYEIRFLRGKRSSERVTGH
ncbi:hypothetical protein [Rhizobium wenxiniae]|uniref:hypothetical protein n=1 Tax=Rhizobium wenxiniae TaxID=1737357 RepID=UPI003C23E7A9